MFKFVLGHSKAWLFYNRFLLCLKSVHNHSKSYCFSFLDLSRLFHCSVIKVVCCSRLSDNFYILSKLIAFVKNFFELFLKFKTQKEGFEPSRRFPDLYPQQGHLFGHLSTSACPNDYNLLINCIRYICFLRRNAKYIIRTEYIFVNYYFHIFLYSVTVRYCSARTIPGGA